MDAEQDPKDSCANNGIFREQNLHLGLFPSDVVYCCTKGLLYDSKIITKAEDSDGKLRTARVICHVRSEQSTERKSFQNHDLE